MLANEEVECVCLVRERMLSDKLEGIERALIGT